MNQYDFNILSWEEFEEFTKDLLTAELNIPFESFANGPDGGIDLRYSSDKNNHNIVVQCKRYKDVRSLINILREERKKIEKINPKPTRYILALSLNIKKDKIDSIVDLFKPFINNSSDILTSKQLNSILSKHRNVERRHYKLWLSSSNVLNNIINSQVENYTSITQEEIKNTINFYAPVPCFDEAIETLKKNGFIIIAGQPGVGKTTLANIISYYLTADGGFEEIISLPQDFHQAVNMMSKDPNKKQLFLFDDFLGSNFLHQKLSRHEDTVFNTLISKIQRLKQNKALIMTTREYILNQAKQSVDIFNDTNLIDAKYIIDLSKYDKITKAKILCNHIRLSSMPDKHLEYFVNNKVYTTIIKHINYSPRLIENINKQRLWEDYKPEDFSNKIIDMFDHPWSLYEDIFENKIKQDDRDVMLIMMSIGKKILFERLYCAVFSYNKNCDEINFKKSIKVLDGTFLRTSRDKYDRIVVCFLNPSIEDFLLYYYNNHHQTQKRLIASSIYLNQITHPFIISDNTPDIRSALGLSKPILVNQAVKDAIEDKISNEWKQLIWINSNGGTDGFDFFENIAKLLDDSISTNKTKKILLNYLVGALENGVIPTNDIGSAIMVFEYRIELDLEMELYDLPEIVYENYAQSIAQSIFSYENLCSIKELGDWGGEKERLSKTIIDIITLNSDYADIFAAEIKARLSDEENADDIYCESMEVLKAYGLDDDFFDEIINEWTTPLDIYEDSEFYLSKNSHSTQEDPKLKCDEDQIIDNMFNSINMK